MTVDKLSLNLNLPGMKPLKLDAPSVDTSIRKAATAKTADAKEQEKTKKACEDFEAIFLNFVLSKMRDTIPKDGLMGNDQATNLYRGMLDEEMSKQMAASGGVGLAEMMYRQLSMAEQKK